MRGKKWKVTIQFDTSDKNSDLSKSPAIVQKLQDILKLFAQRVKRHVTMHIVSGPGFAPYPSSASHVHFVVGAAPPGDVQQRDRSHVCGIRLHEKGRYIAMWGPTKGYGATVDDEEKGVVAQFVGSTIYLYIPSPPRVKFLFEGDEGGELYMRAFRLAWKGYMGKRKEPDTREIAGVTDFITASSLQKQLLPTMLGEKLKEIDDNIATLTDALRVAYTEKQMYIGWKDAEEARDKAHLIPVAREEWRRMSGNKLVKRLLWVDDALHVETRDIIAGHKGKRYRYGTMMLRLPSGGTPAVWALKPAHPKRIAHPHISSKGTACFGNVATPIAQAAGESRLADELDLLLGWLVDGYDASIAATKIEEWPQVRSRKRRRK